MPVEWNKSNTPPYPRVIPDLQEWPIVKFNRKGLSFVDSVIEETVKNLTESTGGYAGLLEEIAEVMYLEKIRYTHSHWSVDPDDEDVFWKHVRSRLIKFTDSKEEDHEGVQILIKDIIGRYGNEILGNFKIPTYKFAQQFLPFAFNRLLNASSSKNFSRIWGNRYGIHDRVHLTGEIDQIRKLAKTGTLIMVPTHHSNLDSILIGYAIDALGLPAFSYGAGLNLFSAKILAYFMNRLGAYKVDRRKKNAFYLETLKVYSTQLLEEGCHSLFFPGGTRSRSGAIEQNLKLGLLSTVVEAQRRNIFKSGGKDYKKIFIVPAVLNYHFVLEAPALINDHLKRIGKERYFIEQDRFSTSYKIAKFIFQFFTQSSDLVVSYGRCMDVMGNPVDDDGNSIAVSGRQVDIADYFKAKGQLSVDVQRDSVYTKMLGDSIVDSYMRNNVVMSSHIVAFTAFRLFQKKLKLDLYSLLRLHGDDLILPYDDFAQAVEQVVARLSELSNAGKVKLDVHVKGEVDKLIEHGLQNLGVYHNKLALKVHTSADITSEDMNLLYFYHNRLEGYELEKYV